MAVVHQILFHFLPVSFRFLFHARSEFAFVFVGVALLLACLATYSLNVFVFELFDEKLSGSVCV